MGQSKNHEVIFHFKKILVLAVMFAASIVYGQTWNSATPPTVSGNATITIAAGATGNLVVPENATITIVSVGEVNNGSNLIGLNLVAPTSKVIWQANYTGTPNRNNLGNFEVNSISILGDGEFELADGGSIVGTGIICRDMSKTTITINGGIIKSPSVNPRTNYEYLYAIGHFNGHGSVVVLNSGLLIAANPFGAIEGSIYSEHDKIVFNGGAAISYMPGTFIEGSTTGIKSIPVFSATWAISDGVAGISYGDNQFYAIDGVEVVPLADVVWHDQITWNSGDLPLGIRDGATITIAAGASGTLNLPSGVSVNLVSAGSEVVDNGNRTISLNIPKTSKVKWTAKYTGNDWTTLQIYGDGEFEVADGAEIGNTFFIQQTTSSGGTAIFAGNLVDRINPYCELKITVSGGLIHSEGPVINGYVDLDITSGEVRAVSDRAYNGTGIMSKNMTMSGGLIIGSSKSGSRVVNAKTLRISGGEIRGLDGADLILADTITILDGVISTVNAYTGITGQVNILGGKISMHSPTRYDQYGQILLSGGTLIGGNVNISGGEITQTGSYIGSVISGFGEITGGTISCDSCIALIAVSSGRMTISGGEFITNGMNFPPFSAYNTTVFSVAGSRQHYPTAGELNLLEGAVINTERSRAILIAEGDVGRVVISGAEINGSIGRAQWSANSSVELLSGKINGGIVSIENITVAGGEMNGSIHNGNTSSNITITGGVVNGRIENRGGSILVSGGLVRATNTSAIFTSVSMDGIEPSVVISGGEVISVGDSSRWWADLATIVAVDGSVEVSGGIVRGSDVLAIAAGWRQWTTPTSTDVMISVSGGLVISNEYNAIGKLHNTEYELTVSDNASVVAYRPGTHVENSKHGLSFLPENAPIFWAKKDGEDGVSYNNGNFLALEDINLISADKIIWNEFGLSRPISNGDEVIILNGAKDTLKVPANATITISSLGTEPVSNAERIVFDIPATSKVIWTARYESSYYQWDFNGQMNEEDIHGKIEIIGTGEFEITDGASIEAINTGHCPYLIIAKNGSNLTVSGGSVKTDFNTAILSYGNVVVSGGIVVNNGNGAINLRANNSSLSISGGVISGAVGLSGTFSITGGVITRGWWFVNPAPTITFSGGLVLTGGSVSSLRQYITDNGVAITTMGWWETATYQAGSQTDLTFEPESANVFWGKKDGQGGIFYNGNFWPVEGVIIEGETFIRPRQSTDNRHGILLENAIVSDFAKISVITPEQATINLRIIDAVGNVVFETVGAGFARPAHRMVDDLGGQTPPLQNAVVWNLTNANRRYVANGTYLIIAEATTISGRRFTYSARIGINR